MSELDEALQVWGERRDRLVQFIDLRYGGKKSGFARACGITPQRLDNYINQGQTAGAEMLVNWMIGGLNPAWYLVGDGPMDFTPNADPEQLARHREQLVAMRQLVDSLREMIDKLMVSI